jgi:cytosine/adenosine deaminase-related metal-dependent hydrolase
MTSVRVLSGQAFLDENLTLRPADIIIENGVITAIEERSTAPPLWICPGFFNAHTHLGDTVAMDCTVNGNLAALVTPPGGLKHRILAGTPRQNLVAGMRASMKWMAAGGTFGCADFREGGIEGVQAFREAAAGISFHPVIFGRDGGEREAEGLGISSTRDINGIEPLVADARRRGNIVAFHAGERDCDDVDPALAFDPDLLIHMTYATKKQLQECAEKEIPVAICPRSNWTLGVASTARNPPVKMMLDLGCTVLIGTDNAMFVPPDMFSEMAFTAAVYHLPPRALIHAAVGGSALAGSSFFIRKGSRAALFTVDPSRSALQFSRDPAASIVKRLSAGMIRNNVFNV